MRRRVMLPRSIVHFRLIDITTLANYLIQPVIKENNTHQQPKSTNHLTHSLRLYQQHNTNCMKSHIQTHKHNHKKDILSIHSLTYFITIHTPLTRWYLQPPYGSMTQLAFNNLLHLPPLSIRTVLKPMLKILCHTMFMYKLNWTSALTRSY